MKKNILISSGGSGGHMIPATIFYEHLKGSFNVCISSDQRGLQFLDKAKYDLKIINTTNGRRKFIIITVSNIFNIISNNKILLFFKKKKN